MGFFGDMWNGIKNVGKKVWHGVKNVGRTVSNVWKQGRKIADVVEKIPIVGDAVKSIPGYSTVKNVGDTVSGVVDSL